MLLEIILAASGSITTITCASLWFVSVLDKRDRQDQAREEAALAQEEYGAAHPPQPVTNTTIYPFVSITEKTQCVFCGDYGQNRGPNFPTVCKSDDCPVKNAPHSHMSCATCQGKWFMAPKSQTGSPLPPSTAKP